MAKGLSKRENDFLSTGAILSAKFPAFFFEE
jgi:hypothetical protein